MEANRFAIANDVSYLHILRTQDRFSLPPWTHNTDKIYIYFFFFYEFFTRSRVHLHTHRSYFLFMVSFRQSGSFLFLFLSFTFFITLCLILHRCFFSHLHLHKKSSLIRTAELQSLLSNGGVMHSSIHSSDN